MRRRYVFAAIAATALLGGGRALGQVVENTEPEVPPMERELEHVAGEEEPFVLGYVAPFRRLNDFMNRIDKMCPLAFGADAAFLSDWLDEGFNSAKKGLQIHQIYWVELTREMGDMSFGAGFEYFQIDTTGAVEGPSTLERDFTVYAPLTWKIFSVSPIWTYIKIDGGNGDDSGEIGCELSIECPLNPAMVWNYDYDDGKGHYLEWSIHHDIDVCVEGRKLFVFTPSMAMGANLRKFIDRNTLTHIDWGLDLSVPIAERFMVTGLLHFTKSLTRMNDEDGVRLFENILPWAGLSLAAEF